MRTTPLCVTIWQLAVLVITSLLLAQGKYDVGNLHEQLSSAMRAFLATPPTNQSNRNSGVLQYSRIFASIDGQIST